MCRVADHTQLANMKKREKKVGYLDLIKDSFYGQGKIGGWNDVATPDVDVQMDKWIAKNSFGLDIQFRYK